MAKYRLRVGRRHKVQPGAIVGALANEGGLSRADFGHIDIHGDHTLVELPAQLPAGTLEALKRTRVSGQLIEITLDDGPPARRRPGQPGAADTSYRKPRRSY
jgi:ATP-dependent RNA helicase DeaD